MTALDRLRLRAAGLCPGRPAQALYFLGGWSGNWQRPFGAFSWQS